MFDLLIVKPLANVLFTIVSILPGHDFGLAVILMTAALRFALWPLLAKQLHSQKKMQALQPEIAKLKEKSGGDKQKESAMLMELYKEKEINPLASCIPLIIQLPFLIGLYAVFTRSATGVAGFESLLYEPVKNFAYIKDIIANPSLFSATLFGVVDLAAKHNIPLAVIAGATQFFQVWQLTPKNANKDKSDPNAAITRMTMWLFPVLTAWIGYGLVAALPLYWAVSNAVSIFQQTIIMRGEVDHMEEAEVVKTTVRTSDKAITAAKSTKKRKKGK